MCVCVYDEITAKDGNEIRVAGQATVFRVVQCALCMNLSVYVRGQNSYACVCFVLFL